MKPSAAKADTVLAWPTKAITEFGLLMHNCNGGIPTMLSEKMFNISPRVESNNSISAYWVSLPFSSSFLNVSSRPTFPVAAKRSVRPAPKNEHATREFAAALAVAWAGVVTI